MAKKPNLQDKSVEELTKLLAEKREELRTLRFTAAGSRTKDTNAASKMRKDIARLMTTIAAKKAA